MDNLLEHVNLLALVEKDVPALAGTLRGRYTKEVACPKCGGVTRFAYRPATDKYPEMVFCSHCAPKGLNAIQYVEWLRGIDRQSALGYLRTMPNLGSAKCHIPQPDKPLDLQLAMNYHHTAGNWRPYFHSRGITDALIDEYKLGFNIRWNRYSIPCFVGGELWGIQYRIRPEVETKLKAAGKKYCKYTSEPGSHNKQLFNADYVSRPLPYVVVIEGPLDVVMLRRFGIPACAGFAGNNQSKAWDCRWNKYLRQVDSVIIVPDVDPSGIGDLIALSKLNDIPHSHIQRLPDGSKDIGEYIGRWLNLPEGEIRQKLFEWLQRPPIRGL